MAELTCELCQTTVPRRSRDQKYCNDCKEEKEHKCLCGCGNTVRYSRYQFEFVKGKTGYLPGHNPATSKGHRVRKIQSDGVLVDRDFKLKEIPCSDCGEPVITQTLTQVECFSCGKVQKARKYKHTCRVCKEEVYSSKSSLACCLKCSTPVNTPCNKCGNPNKTSPLKAFDNPNTASLSTCADCLRFKTFGTCITCSSFFHTNNFNQKECPKCIDSARTRRPKKTPINCSDCGNEFISKFTIKDRCQSCYEKGHKHTCVICNSEFYNKDIKGSYCKDCQKKTEHECACGCGEILQRSKVNIYLSPHDKPYAKGHSNKGKTYLEIYGTVHPACGYQPGEANVAKRPEIREKISEGVSELYEQGKKDPVRRRVVYNGNSYRSRFEVEIVKFFNENSIAFEYEKKIKLSKRIDQLEKRFFNKIVDFVVGKYYIEATGLYRDESGSTFIEKINLLQKNIPEDSKIIVIARVQENLDILTQSNFPVNIPIYTFEDFCQNFKSILQI